MKEMRELRVWYWRVAKMEQVKITEKEIERRVYVAKCYMLRIEDEAILSFLERLMTVLLSPKNWKYIFIR